MPVYEYACRACGERFDRLVPHAEADRPGPCPACEADDVRRAFSRVAVKLQGWGFSKTDGIVPERSGRGDFKTVSERAERIAEGGD